MKNEKRKFTAEFKVTALREHLENQVRALNKICGQYNIIILFM
jgi:transposase